MTSFADLTTLRVGGEPTAVLAPASTDELVAAARELWATGDEWLAVGGGSNILAADGDLDVTVLRVLTRGGERLPAPAGRARVRVAAGESWSSLVDGAVASGLSGIEALAGIPGTVGAAPVQNIGAYGQELGDALVAVDFLDADSGEHLRLDAVELELGYRTSVIKQGRRGIVTAVELELADVAGGDGAEVRYAQLATALDVPLGSRAPVAAIRDAVLRLRASKGMLLDPADPDSVSAGSFFTNPIVSSAFTRDLPADAPRYPVAPEPADVAVPLGFEPAMPSIPSDQRVKLSAAWLIEHAGIARGFRLPGSQASVSSKHTLALVTTGHAPASDVGELARFVQTRVMSEFGVLLQPEPLLVGMTL